MDLAEAATPVGTTPGLALGGVDAVPDVVRGVAHEVHGPAAEHHVGIVHAGIAGMIRRVRSVDRSLGPLKLAGLPLALLAQQRPLGMGVADVLKEDELAVLPVRGEGSVGVLSELGLALPLGYPVLGLLFGSDGIELEELWPRRPAAPLVAEIASPLGHLRVLHTRWSVHPGSQGRVHRHDQPAGLAHAEGTGLACALL